MSVSGNLPTSIVKVTTIAAHPWNLGTQRTTHREAVRIRHDANWPAGPVSKVDGDRRPNQHSILGRWDNRWNLVPWQTRVYSLVAPRWAVLNGRSTTTRRRASGAEP